MAARYWVGGNATWDGTAGSKWALTSGGAGGQAVPTSADDVFLDNGTGTGNVTTATSATICTCKTFICTGYVGTLTINGSILVAGNITIVAGMTFATTAGTPLLQMTTTGSWTSNGKTFPYAITLAPLTASQTITFVDDWTVTGIVTHSTNSATINGSNIFFSGNLAGSTLGGTTIYHFKGTSNWNSGSLMKNSITFNTAGTITVGSAVSFQGIMTHTLGTITTTSSTLTLTGTSTLDTASISWNNITISATSTITLSSALSMVGAFNPNSGNVTFSGAFNIACATASFQAGTTTLSGDVNCTGSVTQGNTIITGAFNLNVGGGFTKTAGNSNGTTTIVMNGTGTVTTGASAINNPFVINTAGTITFSGTSAFSNNFTYTTGTIAAVSTPIILIFAGTPTFTFNALFIFSGTLNAGTGPTFAGTSGFLISTFICTTAGAITTFKSINTYTVTTGITITGTLSQKIAFLSSTGGSKAILTLQNGATQDIGFCNATDIDSNAGQCIYTRKGTITTTNNWRLLVAPVTISSTF